MMVEETVETQATKIEARSESTCQHRFERHIGIRVFNKTGMAWVQLSMVSGADDALQVWLCVWCGEQGYKVPA